MFPYFHTDIRTCSRKYVFLEQKSNISCSKQCLSSLGIAVSLPLYLICVSFISSHYLRLFTKTLRSILDEWTTKQKNLSQSLIWNLSWHLLTKTNIMSPLSIFHIVLLYCKSFHLFLLLFSWSLWYTSTTVNSLSLC